MEQQQFEKRKERAASEALVISRTEEGFRVYSPASPTKSYVVSGSPEAPACTCPDFLYHKGDPEWRCKHIIAVLNQIAKTQGEPAVPEAYAAEERAAIQHENAKAQRREAAAANNGASQMLIKRSVSPDGRIDSVSVEFSLPVSSNSKGEIKDKALTTLKLQRDIVGTFLKLNGQKPASKLDQSLEQPEPEKADGKPVPAQMIDIGKVNSKWGERYCINMQVNGRRTRLFGSAEELSTQLAAAGYEVDPENIQEGLRLNVPCRVTLKPSADGKYLNVEQVFPVARKVSRGGRHDSAFA